MKRGKRPEEAAEESFIQAMADADISRPCGVCGGIVNGVIGSSCDCDKPSREGLREGLAKLICDTYYEEERFDSELRAEKNLWRMAADAILARYIVLMPEGRDRLVEDEREACAQLALAAHGAGAHTKAQRIIAVAIRERTRTKGGSK